MTLLELYASLVLDMTKFGADIETAKTDVKSVGEEISALSGTAPDMTSFTDAVSAASNEAKADAESVESKLEEVQNASGTAQAVVEGFASATDEVVQEVIEGLVEFGKEAIELAAESGSAAAQEYARASDRFEYSVDRIKTAAGSLLITLGTGLKSGFAALFSDDFLYNQDRFLDSLEAIDAYTFENLEIARANVKSFFGVFEEAEMPEVADIGGLSSALESQTVYWQEYADTIASLQSKNINPEILADLADGTAEGLERMKALDEADAETAATFAAAYEELQAAQESAATAMSETRLAVDETFQTSLDAVAEFVAGTDQSSAAYANMTLTAASISGALEDEYPTISMWVDTIIAKIKEIGQVQVSVPQISVPERSTGSLINDMRMVGSGFSSGISYVPHDNFLARLHKGEEVLTAQEASVRRRDGDFSRNAQPVQPIVNNIYLDTVAQTADEVFSQFEYGMQLARFRL